MSPHLGGDPHAITAAQLSEVLNTKVSGITDRERIGTGQMSRNFRLILEGDGPASIVVKVPAEEAATRELGANSYRREVAFYGDVSHRIDGGIATCHHYEITDDGTSFLLVLDDLAPAEQGDQLAGCSVADAEQALSNLAHLHAAGWNDHELLGGRAFERGDEDLLTTIYGMALDEFRNRYDDRVAPGTAAVLEALRPAASQWSAHRPGPVSIVHGDYRLDNLLFSPHGVAAVDWQTVSAGPPSRDVAYFLGNSLTIDDRRAHEQHLLDHYRGELADRGIEYGEHDLREHYALGGWLGPLVTVVGAFVASRTDRGDEMFIAMADRAASQLSDHGSLELLAALSA